MWFNRCDVTSVFNSQRLSEHRFVALPLFFVTIFCSCYSLRGEVVHLPTSAIPSPDSLCVHKQERAVYVCVCVDAEGGGDINYNAKLLSQGLICCDERKACLPPRSAMLHTPAKLERPLDRKSFFFFFGTESLFPPDSVNKPPASH